MVVEINFQGEGNWLIAFEGDGYSDRFLSNSQIAPVDILDTQVNFGVLFINYMLQVQIFITPIQNLKLPRAFLVKPDCRQN